ncbi:hypothetical protein RAS14_04505 [Achromobacter aegrifaciens]|uniref:hypothetical protein n=1 Tax=Achromobacter aegrifaciens TaxID=1287736 RepID=UPI00279427D2|nr:hypothetical protein [Achromobacter aegrifaciens]MDQ1758999.1 hypothetical protein [Achromobacter aegrifaciens]
MAIANHARRLLGRFKRFCSSNSQTSHSADPCFQPERAATTPMVDKARSSSAYFSNLISSSPAIPLSEGDLQEFEALLASLWTPGAAAYYRQAPDSLTPDAFLKYCVVPMLIAEVRRLQRVDSGEGA